MKKFILLSLLIYLFNTDFLFSQWVSYSNGITKSSNYSFYNDNNTKLYAANSNGLYFSTNEGIKWQKLSLNADLNFFMKNNTYLYSGGNGGLYLSSNDGTDWIKVINSYTCSVVSLGSNLYAAVQNNGVLKSTNYGFNWESALISYWNSVTSLAVKDNYIFAGLSSGEYSPGQVIYSTNGGNNWSSTGLDSVSVTTLYAKNQFIFAGTAQNGLFRSSDNGNTWTNIAFQNNPIRLIKYIDSTLYVSWGIAYYDVNGFYKSTNNGINWLEINKPYKSGVVAVERINNTLITGIEGRGIFLSYNNGINWSHYLHYNSTISSLFSSNSRLFAGVNDEGIYYSDDNGFNWIHSNLLRITPYDFTTTGSNLFAATDRFSSSYADTGGVFISTDNGTHWNLTNLRASITYTIKYINNLLYAGIAYGGVYTSSNNGINWIRISNYPAYVPYCFFLKGSKLFVGSFTTNNILSGLYFTSNNGLSWDSANIRLSVQKIAGNSNYLFATVSNPWGYFKGYYRSSDGGINWDTSTINKYIQDFVINGNYIFAIAGSDGIHMSSDNGITWKIKNEGLINNDLRQLCIFNGYIFSGSYGYGIYRRTIQDITEVKQNSIEIPDNFSLSQNYPNPFNPTTNIKYQIKNKSLVKLKIFDILGKEIETLVNEKQSTGTYEVSWDGSAYPSGVYFYKLIAGDFSETKRMLMIK